MEDKHDTYQKEYRIRPVGDGGIEISVPKLIVERAARRAGVSIDDFIKSHNVIHLFNDFKEFDAAYKFVPKEENGNGTNH